MPGLLSEFTVVLDACVLAPMPVCDTLLRLADERSFFRPKWSGLILDEVVRTLEKFGYTPEQALHRRQQMELHFREALVCGSDSLVDGIKGLPDSNDRHVVGAAVLSHADAIVTSNTKHFPSCVLGPFGIEVITPDRFLIYQLHLDPEELMERIEDQAMAIRWTIDKLLERLRRHAPKFVAEVCALREQA